MGEIREKKNKEKGITQAQKGEGEIGKDV